MQKLQQSIQILLLLFMVLLGTVIEVNAEQVNSVRDCIEQPEKCSDPSPAPDQSEDSIGEDSKTVGITIWDLFKMVLATLFVIALLYFLLKFINKKSYGYKDSQIIQNMGGTPLGANRSVQILKVGEKVLIVGVGENIQLLKEIEDEEEARQIIEEYNHKMEQLLGPSDIVTKVLKRTKTMNIEEKEKGNASFPSILKKQLETISKERKKLFDEMEKKGSDKR